MCQQGAWDFEDMTLGGFRILNDPSAAARVGLTGPAAHSGEYTFGDREIGRDRPARAVYQVGQAMCPAAASSRQEPST